MRGFGATASLFPGRTLTNATHTSPGNPVEFNQSDVDFDTPEVFPDKCTICIRRLANGPWAWRLRLRLTPDWQINASLHLLPFFYYFHLVSFCFSILFLSFIIFLKEKTKHASLGSSCTDDTKYENVNISISCKRQFLQELFLFAVLIC